MSQSLDNATRTTTLVEFHVPDFSVVKEFYGLLNFRIVWEEKPHGMNGFLVMQLEENVICFFCGNEEVYNEPYFKQFPKTTLRGYGVQVGFPVSDIDAYYTEVRSRIDSKYVFQELQLQPWGVKDFRVVDPNGYFVRFAEPVDFLKEIILGDTPYLKEST